MANPHRGEVALDAAGKWVLRYGVNALCELESALGLSVAAAVSELGAGASVRVLRTMVRVGLSDRHPELDDRAAGGIMDEVGLEAVTRRVMAAFAAAFPAATDAEGGTDAGPPPEAADGSTGADS